MVNTNSLCAEFWTGRSLEDAQRAFQNTAQSTAEATQTTAQVELRIVRTAPPLRTSRADKPKPSRDKTPRTAMEFGIERVLRCRTLNEGDMTIIEITTAREIVRSNPSESAPSDAPAVL